MTRAISGGREIRILDKYNFKGISLYTNHNGHEGPLLLNLGNFDRVQIVKSPYSNHFECWISQNPEIVAKLETIRSSVWRIVSDCVVSEEIDSKYLESTLKFKYKQSKIREYTMLNDRTYMPKVGSYRDVKNLAIRLESIVFYDHNISIVCGLYSMEI